MHTYTCRQEESFFRVFEPADNWAFEGTIIADFKYGYERHEGQEAFRLKLGRRGKSLL